ARWVDSVLGNPAPVALPKPLRQAATVMLGLPQDGFFMPQFVDGGSLFAQALSITVSQHGLRDGQLQIGEFGWLGDDRYFIHAVPRDNADFVAQATVVLDADGVDIRAILP